MQQTYNHLLCLPWHYKPSFTYNLSHNYTQSPTASHSTINLHSPTICLSQRYEPPLIHCLSCKMQQTYNHLLCLPWRYKPSFTYNLFLTTIQSSIASHSTINIHSPTICLSQRYEPPLIHCLSCKMQQTYYHLLCLPWRYKSPFTYCPSVKMLQKLTDCLSQCYKLSPAVKYKPSHSFVGWASRSVSHSSTNICCHSDLLPGSLNYRQTAAEIQKMRRFRNTGLSSDSDVLSRRLHCNFR